MVPLHKLFALSGFVTEMLVVAGGPGAAAVLAAVTLARRFREARLRAA